MTSVSVAYAAGRSAWLDGKPMPPMPPDDAPEADQLFWLGFQRERFRDYLMRRRIAIYPDKVEMRP